MNTYFKIFPSHITPLFKVGRLLDLTFQKKKIFIIVSCTLGLLAALYLAKKYGPQFKMPEGKLTALKKQHVLEDSLIRVKNLDSLPKNKVLETSEGTYHTPNVSMLDINKFLEPYIKRNGYAGASFSMSTNQIYGKTISGNFFTGVYFRKKDFSFYNRVQNCFDSLFKPVSGVTMREKELKEYVSPMINKWGYESIQIGNVDKEFFSEKTGSNYELYLLLFFKKYNSSDS